MGLETKIKFTVEKHKGIKILEYNIGKNLDNLGYDSDFLDITPKT